MFCLAGGYSPEWTENFQVRRAVCEIHVDDKGRWHTTTKILKRSKCPKRKSFLKVTTKNVQRDDVTNKNYNEIYQTLI